MLMPLPSLLLFLYLASVAARPAAPLMLPVVLLPVKRYLMRTRSPKKKSPKATKSTDSDEDEYTSDDVPDVDE